MPGIPGAEQIQSSLHCYVAETHQEAMEGFKRPVGVTSEVFAEAGRRGPASNQANTPAITNWWKRSAPSPRRR
jgi:hypothetical protein